ncbi:delta-lactam-biosynthetic de-N-acetylase [Aquibacillus koreensis]|uniref:Delta-lactam-biosynthetic de-N-acetylase n=1 Tax=Aquibacillus koreensis TaxID=279446 RepID=A0A9X3WQT4_9BACI|nr:delta-lactam-biosynthetic de-N-acetylase [Aquibacillus koreensis]MCT2534417.1 delta-lactam-biosynthetic de-N-acetylase [Aquibacillus koreensis]MDC3421724.1 delta-lactam-biosynthetic de-N-acetylase [Aquibacillus koreensis]
MKKKSLIIITLFLSFVLFPMSMQAESYGWGYKKSSDNQPPQVGKYGNILKENGGYYIDDSGDKVVYLTFDNGYEEGYTNQILDVLNDKDVPATFFVTGHYVKDQPDLVRRMANDGHIIGNHSYHHPDLTALSKEKMKKELDLLQQEVAKITGEETMNYLRPPKGTFNDQTLKWANELGYMHIFWSLAFVDWHTDSQQGWKSAYHQVMKQIHPGAIILLHTVSKDNAEALEHLIDDLRKQGYTFKSIDDLVIKDMIPKQIFGL